MYKVRVETKYEEDLAAVFIVTLEGGDINAEQATQEIRGIVTKWATSWLKYEGVKVSLQDTGLWEQQ